MILVVPLVVEQLFAGLSYVPVLDWLAPIVKFLPFTAGQRLAHLGGETDVEFFDRWVSGGVFTAFAAIVLTITWTQFTHRDA